MEMLKTYHLFTKILIHTKIPLYGGLHKKIFEFVNTNYEKEKVDKRHSIINGMQHHEEFDGKEELDIEINKQCLLLTSQKITNGWLNVIDNKAHNLPHHHQNNLQEMSGVYYLSAKNSTITFTQMGEVFELVPKQFDLLLFPSGLVHYVFPSESEEKRISYAFNLTANLKEE